MEVISPTTKKIDAIDKYLQYRRIAELQYYLLVEPAKKIVQLISRIDAEEWKNEYYTLPDEAINLPAIHLSFLLRDWFE
jgi:Uma2 family endonuclease